MKNKRINAPTDQILIILLKEFERSPKQIMIKALELINILKVPFKLHESLK
jgi:hypothetical protein